MEGYSEYVAIGILRRAKRSPEWRNEKIGND
jgi:hypothetical protein